MIFNGRAAFDGDQKQKQDNVVSLFILVLTAICIAWLFRGFPAPGKDFYNELWAPAYLLVRGESPYDTASLNPVLPAAWFPQAIGFFFPLGWLDEASASLFWYGLNILFLCALILLAYPKPRKPWLTFLLALFSFFFPPTLNHLYLGQISITVTLCLVLTDVFSEKNRKWLAAIALSLALSKPHLAALPLAGLSLFEYRRGGGMAMLLFWGRTAAMSLALCLPLFAAEPNWIPDALVSMRNNPFWLYPSLFIVYRRMVAGWEYPLWALTFLAALALALYLWHKRSLHAAMAWSLALAPIASPYVGSWDFVLILPLFLRAFSAADARRRMILAAGYVAAWVGMALVQIQPGSDNHFFWWVPLWFTALIGAVTFRHCRGGSIPS